MAYLCLDDGFSEHPKIVGLSDAAYRCHVDGLCYCARALTDGVLDQKQARKIGRLRARNELVSAGVWERLPKGAGYRIHDYLQYNPSKEQVLQKRLKSRERLQRWREQKGNAAGNAVTNASSNAAPTPTPTPSALSEQRGLGGVAPPRAAPPPQKQQLVIDAMGLRISEKTATDLLAMHGADRFAAAVEAGRQFGAFQEQQDAFYAALNGDPT